MTPVDQAIVDKGDGDCFRAAVASVLDMTLEQVPHFIRFGQIWHTVYRKFMRMFGWEYAGTCDIRADRGLLEEDSINGYFIVSVPSATYDDVMHSVICDADGLIVHDPNPNKLWKGRNISEGANVQWNMFEKCDGL